MTAGPARFLVECRRGPRKTWVPALSAAMVPRGAPSAPHSTFCDRWAADACVMLLTADGFGPDAVRIREL